MLRFPLKKIRKQFKLLLLLVLLTFAVWFTYLHINQGKAMKLHFNYGKDSLAMFKYHSEQSIIIPQQTDVRLAE
ncbi:hypothetical protein AOLI_G00184850 [Acnodon oligacanthus]